MGARDGRLRVRLSLVAPPHGIAPCVAFQFSSAPLILKKTAPSA